MKFSTALAVEYNSLFESAVVLATRKREIERTISRIALSVETYLSVSATLGVPWFVVGIFHALEASLAWDKHLHNGDPLTARTVRVPQGRPRQGEPPFSWEESAVDALRLHALDAVDLWSVARTCYELERYNGFGYRSRQVRSPYLWAGSQHYVSGKYIKDGVWSPTAVSQQIGGAVLLKAAMLLGIETEVDDAI